MSTFTADAPVCITGATGYIAAFIVKDLLERGHHVRGTVRSLSATSKLAHLRALPHADTKLQLVEANLVQPETFPDALAGAGALIHTATPIVVTTGEDKQIATVAEAEEKQLRPAVDGTRALLEAAAAAGIRKVVLTSSTSAMNYVAKAHDVLDESCWSDEAYARSRMLTDATAAYALAKTRQERAALEVGHARGLDVVCINPCVVGGPTLTQHLNASLEYLLVLGKGEGYPLAGRLSQQGRIPDWYLNLVDVRDVARAHVLAVEKAAARGRYLLMWNVVHAADVVRVMREAVAGFARLPEMEIDSVDGGRHAVAAKFDNARAKELGVEGIRWEDTIAEAARALATHLE